MSFTILSPKVKMFIPLDFGFLHYENDLFKPFHQLGNTEEEKEFASNNCMATILSNVSLPYRARNGTSMTDFYYKTC